MIRSVDGDFLLSMMPKPPFPIPPSIDAYVRLYDTEPDKAILKMETAFLKRRSDPVLLTWLCWMYLEKGDRAHALRRANIAMSQAPGSPIIEQLRYVCVHPKGFDALVSRWTSPAIDEAPSSTDFGVPFDLDSLIAKLNHAGSSKIKLPDPAEPAVDMAKESEKRGKIATHTLAMVHEKQGRFKEALAIYDQLIAAKPDRAATYAEHITRIKAKIEETG